MKLKFFATNYISFLFIVALSLILVPTSKSEDVEYFITWGTNYSVHPASGNTYHMTRKVDQFGSLMGSSWNPQKPPTHAFYFATIYATGCGKVEFTFSEGASAVRQVGEWGKRWYTLNICNVV